ncbi:hypothetical protein BDL97_04G092000 [Sphagnum fallax]|nr:hypothetical protein BDL97_04G092000 [Sphagnum fallax]KAH8964938.1 hypothetical protein BDL97_04G092000 [Sphagnum fallax]KAH8964939.1 hypothetical protein BDL97_04G092000 [Sphagnum fallax]
MQRHAQSRRVKARRHEILARLLWLTGYICVTVGLLMSTHKLFPDLLSILHSSGHKPEVLPLRISGTGIRSRVSLLSWEQNFVPPHLSRTTKLDVTNSVWNVLAEKLWKPPSDQGFVPCVDPSPSYTGPGKSRGYLMVATNGGLNQMRAGICDMVAVARILNATLVIPELDKRSFWQDSSNFSDVFDVDHFIESLQGDVPIIKMLPEALHYEPKIVKEFQSWSNVKYYEEDIASLWSRYKIIKAAKSDSRLANNNLPPDIQKLRCRVHYEALRFAPHIEAFGKKLVERMRSNGPFIAVHLRYEKDMLAFSGCTYGLNKTEALELTTMRQDTPHWKIKRINAANQRSQGFCPLTPTEVGVFLKALGYPESTRIYVAAGEIYGGQERMAGFFSHFPNIMKKETIASTEELAPFVQHDSQMAALDYIVSVESDVFVPSFSGNMARAVEGHRRFLGHRKTINPDRKSLVALFDKLNVGELEEGPELGELVTQMHKNRQGAPRKRYGPIKGTKGRERLRTEESFYTNPSPECLCMKPGNHNVNSMSIATIEDDTVENVQNWESHLSSDDHLE